GCGVKRQPSQEGCGDGCGREKDARPRAQVIQGMLLVLEGSDRLLVDHVDHSISGVFGHGPDRSGRCRHGLQRCRSALVQWSGMGTDRLVIHGAREHNLKNVTLDLPRGSLVVFTGLSGSGKSSLAFDTIYAEGQRRYVESLSSYARQFLGQMEKPDVDFIEGLSPAISIDQKSTSRNPRSTVGTITEIYDYLRVLYARVGHPHCPKCDGLGTRLEVDPELLVPDQDLSLAQGAIAVWASGRLEYWDRVVEAVASANDFSVDVPWRRLPKRAREVILYGSGDEIYVRYKNRYGRQRSYWTTYEGVVENVGRRHAETDSDAQREKLEQFM